MKKNLVIIALIAIFVLSCFSLNAQEPASNIQGTVYIWNQSSQSYQLIGPGKKIYVYLYRKEAMGGGLYDSGSDYTDGNSFYAYDFINSTTNDQECDLVKVYYNGLWLQDYYDGTVRIDIYYDYEQPEPDPEPDDD